MSVMTILLILLVLASLWTATTFLLLRAAIGLALTSVMLAIIMYDLGAGLAAVIELSVCAGLISVVFVSVISLTQRKPFSDYFERRASRLRRFWPLPVILFVVGIGLSLVSAPVTPAAAPATPQPDVRTFLWSTRQLDLFGQILILLSGVFGVLVLFKRNEKGGE